MSKTNPCRRLCVYTYMCVYVYIHIYIILIICLCACIHRQYRCPQRSEDGTGASGAGVEGTCVPTEVGAGKQTQVLCRSSTNF